MKDLNCFELQKLNSMTKYPSILTYHEIGDKGTLKGNLSENKCFEEDVIVTEKVDGTNGRIIIYNGDYMIGTREDIIYAKGDRIPNPTLGIINTLKPLADKLCEDLKEKEDSVIVVYSEVYGGNVTSASKQYTNSKKWAFRLIDICYINPEIISMIMKLKRDKIATWRDNGGQNFFVEDTINYFIERYHIPRVPYLAVISKETLPTNLKDTYEFLKSYIDSKAIIDSESGKAEGIVVRTQDRSLIRKIRFEDYERTQKRNGL